MLRYFFRSLLILTLLQGALMVSGVPANASGGPCHLQIFEGKASLAGECPQDAKVAVYLYAPGVPAGTPFKQTLPQSLHSTGSNEAVLPQCGPFQADVFTGEVLSVIDQTHQYRERLIDAVHGDQGECVVETTTTTSPATTTTAVLPSTTVATPATLPRTGTSDHADNLATMAAGLIILGLGLSGAAEYRREKSRGR